MSGIPAGRLSWLEVEVAPKKGFRLFQNLDLGRLVAESVAFVVKQPHLHGDPLRRRASAMRWVCSGGTTLSCRPWKNSTGQVICAA